MANIKLADIRPAGAKLGDHRPTIPYWLTKADWHLSSWPGTGAGLADNWLTNTELDDVSLIDAMSLTPAYS